jgi:hypothetical protein
MLKYLAKFASDILPSVAATIIGAYIVNHYITAKPAAPAPAAVSSTAPDNKPADAPTDVANISPATVKAKPGSEKAGGEKAVSEKAGSERAASEKAASEKAASEKAELDKAAAEKSQAKAQEKAKEKTAEKSQEKSEDKSADTASISTDIHRHPAPPREKTAIRTIPLTAPAVQPAASAAVPANPATTVEAAAKADEQRDANDLARAAIERLRENSPRQDTARASDASRVASVPQTPTSVQPLPPPVMVAAPAGDTFGAGSNGQIQQPYGSNNQANDPNALVPPADIPAPQPLELRTDNNSVPPLRQHNRNVAEDMLSAAKSVFHAVLPQ